MHRAHNQLKGHPFDRRYAYTGWGVYLGKFNAIKRGSLYQNCAFQAKNLEKATKNLQKIGKSISHFTNKGTGLKQRIDRNAFLSHR